MLRPSDSIIINGITRILVPFIQIFALYVIFHGHYSPGGGFQGGALFAASILMERVVLGQRQAWHLFPLKLGLPLGIAGLALYAGVGAMGLLGNHFFLDYDSLPFAMEAAALRSLGILIIEIGVAFAVVGTLVAIFDQIVGE